MAAPGGLASHPKRAAYLHYAASASHAESFSAREQVSGIAVPVELGMAKGWESKSVEEQQSEVREAHKPAKPPMTPAEIAQEQCRNGLELSRQRAMQQLQAACNPNHRNMLEKALADLDERLAKLG